MHVDAHHHVWQVARASNGLVRGVVGWVDLAGGYARWREATLVLGETAVRVYGV